MRQATLTKVRIQSSAVQFESSVYFQRATNFSTDKVKAARCPSAFPHQPLQQWTNELLSVESRT